MQAARNELRGLAAALAFLTRVPVRRSVVLDAADVARGAAFFPLVGAGVGAVVGGVTAALCDPLTAPLAAVLGLAAGAALTGALHLDALADTADALGATTRERALEIMRDHSVGSFGAVALVLDLGAKGVALATLSARGHVLVLAVCAGSASRLTPVLLSAALPYARPDGGLGSALAQTCRLRCAVAIAIAAAVCAGVGGVHGAILLAAAVALVVPAIVVARRWLGGITGDVLGATTELAELAALVAAVALT
jgi:adenosylcobinamide-GDP ribazoletransferase